MAVDFAGVYHDDTRPIDVGVFNRFCDELVDQQAQRNGLVGGYNYGIRSRLKPVFRRRTLKVLAKMTDKVREIDKSNLAASPEMIMNFRDWTRRGRPTTDVRLFLTRWLISRVSKAS